MYSESSSSLGRDRKIGKQRGILLILIGVSTLNHEVVFDGVSQAFSKCVYGSNLQARVWENLSQGGQILPTVFSAFLSILG